MSKKTIVQYAFAGWLIEVDTRTNKLEPAKVYVLHPKGGAIEASFWQESDALAYALENERAG